MNKYKLGLNEVILMECDAVNDKNKYNRLILTNGKILIQENKGLFKKQLKYTKTIDLSSIKMYKEKVQIKQKSNEVNFQTIDKSYIYKFNNVAIAKKFTEEIISIKTGKSSLERKKDTLQKFIKGVKDAKVIIGSTVGLMLALKEYFDKKK